MFKEILSISGQSGLFKLISKGKANMVVESLETGKRMPAYSSAKIISLEDIAIFTDSAEVPLKTILKTIAEKENFGQSIDPKSSSNDLKSYFETILPNYDRDRVYVSDIKKVIQWYNSLQKNELLIFETEENQEDNDLNS